MQHLGKKGDWMIRFGGIIGAMRVKDQNMERNCRSTEKLETRADKSPESWGSWDPWATAGSAEGKGKSQQFEWAVASC